jgi:hypothetical protein
MLLFAGAHVLLFWNEGRTLRRETALEDAGQNVRELNAEQRDSSMIEGRLVHATHRAEPTEALEDADVGLVAEFALSALKLSRYDCFFFFLL